MNRQPTQPAGSDSEGVQSQVSKVTVELMAGGLVAHILENPGRFIATASAPRELLTEENILEALAVFSAQDPNLQVHGVCTSFLRSKYPDLDKSLSSSKMSDFTKNRFWPFWDAVDLPDSEVNSEQAVEDYLLELWNEGDEERFYPSMFCETGFPEVLKRVRLGDLFLFKFALPIYRSAGRKPDWLTVAFDSKTKGFYTMNSRIRSSEPEFRFKYLEFIRPGLEAPDPRKYFASGDPKEWRVLFVLDRHIGDNLSLFSTHLRYLSKFPQVDLTLDVSMCPFFKEAGWKVISRFLPSATSVSVLDTLPGHRGDYDLILDPYEWMPGIFDLKPQNDSRATTIVSSIELADFQRRGKRRDILDIHMASLKRMGIVPQDEPIPEFVRYRITPSERASVRQQARSKLFPSTVGNQVPKIIALFPFGLTPDRRYHPKQLQFLIQGLLRDPRACVVVAGTQWDTPEMVQAVRTDWPGVSRPCRGRVSILVQEPLSNLIELMLASDVVVSMDSGPLHLARALRLKPIGLYTDKVNNPAKVLTFPWLVEDNTAEVMMPKAKGKHVSPESVLEAVRRRLS